MCTKHIKEGKTSLAQHIFDEMLERKISSKSYPQKDTEKSQH